MRGAHLVVLAFAGYLAVSLLVLVVAFDPTTEEVALLGGATALAVLTGLGFALREALGGTTARRALPDVSVGEVVAAAGTASILAAAQLGLWLLLVGGGVLVLGVALLVRERRAARRALG